MTILFDRFIEAFTVTYKYNKVYIVGHAKRLNRSLGYNGHRYNTEDRYNTENINDSLGWTVSGLPSTYPSAYSHESNRTTSKMV